MPVIQAGNHEITVKPDVYFENGVATACFHLDWLTKTPLLTSLDVAQEIARHYNLDVEDIHDVVIDALVEEDEPVDLVEDLRQAFRDLKEGRVRPVEELWDRLYNDDDED